MPKEKIKWALAIAIAFQFLVLTGMYAKAHMPLWTGEEVRLKTIPVDPRSLFRGNYARLNYEISTVNASQLLKEHQLRKGEKVYVSLVKNAHGLYEEGEPNIEKPDTGIFIAGRVTRIYSNRLRIKYGIEAYFAPKEEALRLERELRQSAVAVLMISPSGKAVLKSIVATHEKKEP